MTWKELQVAIATPQMKLQKLKKEFEENKLRILTEIQELKSEFVSKNRAFQDNDKVVVTIQLPNGNTSDLKMFIAGVRELTLNGDILYNFKKTTVTGEVGKKVVSDLTYVSIRLA